MADETVTTTFSGLDQLEQRLLEEGPKAAKKVLRKSGKRGGEVMRSAIAERTPRLTGFTGDHIVMVTKADGSNGHLVVVIGPQKDAGYFKGATRHGDKVTFKGEIHYADIAARMEELGSKHQPPRPFMAPAFKDSSEEALMVFVDELWNGLKDLEEK
jgi:HK97 gp10 family phage protein